jgi:hypothetical protein
MIANIVLTAVRISNPIFEEVVIVVGPYFKLITIEGTRKIKVNS